MTPWARRPAELANLLNPAFCGLLLFKATQSYHRESGSGMPLPLTFLVLPIVLHATTRASLPRSVATTLIAWLERSPENRIEFDQRARSLVPFTRESLMFLLDRNCLAAIGGDLVPDRVSPSRYQTSTDEVVECVNRAEFVGRWFARAGDAATIYALFGLQP